MTEKKYLAAEDIIDFFDKHGRGWVRDGEKGTYYYLPDIALNLLRMPTADVVEVVKCKDCENYYWEQKCCHGKTEYLCKKLKIELPSKDFSCIYGKRKSEKNG